MRSLFTFIKRFFITLIGFGLSWALGLLAFILVIPTEPLTLDKPVDAIVVLTGGRGRIDYGLQLLAQNKGKLLFISGVNESSTSDEVLDKAKDRMKAEFPSLHEEHIFIGHEATSTIGNAEETAAWIAKNHIKSVRLVTANYHIPRSLVEFRAILPQIVTVYPDPVFPDSFTRFNWWEGDRVRDFIMSEYHKTLASILRHLILRLENNT